MSKRRDSAAYESLWMNELMAFADQSHILRVWEPLSYLDKGQFSRVFKIRHREKGTLAALKFVPNPADVSDCAEEGSQTNAFHRSCYEASKHEARIMSRFQGERYIAQYLEKPEFLRRTFQNEDGETVVQYAVLICMPLYRNSKEWMPLAEKNPDVCLQLGLNIARALVLFEKKGVYHRDIKPGNIMLDTEGLFCLSDVGEAKLESEFTTVGFHGTRPYMAPEVLRLEGERGKTRSDHRSDIYSLGVVLYKLYNHNQFPFLQENGSLTEAGARSYQKYEKRNKSAGKVLYLTDSERARQLRYDGFKLPAPAKADAALSRIILKACAYSQKDRYQKAVDLYVDLREYAKARAEAAKQIVRKSKRPAYRRNAILSALAATVVIVLGTGLIIHKIASEPAAVSPTAASFSPVPTATLSPAASPAAAVTPSPAPAVTPEPAPAEQPQERPASGLYFHQDSYSVKTDEYVIISWNEVPGDPKYAVALYRQGEEQPIRSLTGPSAYDVYRFVEPGNYRIEVRASNDDEDLECVASISVAQGGEVVETDQIQLRASKTKAAKGEMVVFTVVSDTDEIVLVEKDDAASFHEAYQFYPNDFGYRTSLGLHYADTVDLYVLSSDGRKSNTVTVSWTDEEAKPTPKPTMPDPTKAPISSAAAVSSAASSYRPGDQTEQAGLTFCLQEDQTWAVESGKKTITDLFIPSEVEGLPVTVIQEGAFKQCKNLRSVSIGEGITAIGNYAFRHCSGLKTVALPDSLTTLGASAFAYCRSLQEVTLPANITQIPSLAFVGCFELETVRLPDNLRRIEKEAFKECRNLSSVQLPDGLIAIEYQAFYHCDDLRKIDLPSSVTSIDRTAFHNSNGLMRNIVFRVPRNMNSYAEAYAKEHGIQYQYYRAE